MRAAVLKMGDVAVDAAELESSLSTLASLYQCAHADGRGRQDGDLSHRVEPAKVDEDHVDDVASVAKGGTELHEVLTQARGRVGRRDGQHQRADEGANACTDDQVAISHQRR